MDGTHMRRCFIFEIIMSVYLITLDIFTYKMRGFSVWFLLNPRNFLFWSVFHSKPILLCLPLWRLWYQQMLNFITHPRLPTLKIRFRYTVSRKFVRFYSTFYGTQFKWFDEIYFVKGWHGTKVKHLVICLRIQEFYCNGDPIMGCLVILHAADPMEIGTLLGVLRFMWYDWDIFSTVWTGNNEARSSRWTVHYWDRGVSVLYVSIISARRLWKTSQSRIPCGLVRNAMLLTCLCRITVSQ